MIHQRTEAERVNARHTVEALPNDRTAEALSHGSFRTASAAAALHRNAAVEGTLVICCGEEGGGGGGGTEGHEETPQARRRDVVQALQRVHVQPLAVDQDLHQSQPRRLRATIPPPNVSLIDAFL